VKALLLLVSHATVLAIGVALGIYLLPILIAPPAPSTAQLAAQAGAAQFTGQFKRDLKDSDMLHWGEGTVSIGRQTIALAGKLAPGPDYKLYLAPAFVEDVGRYDAVVLGSGVYAGHWLKPAKEFVDRHEAALRERPVFLFASGPVGAAPKEADEPPEMRAAASLIGANDHRVFGGRITGSQLGPFEKVIVRIVKAPLADDRPWDDIADWAKEIARYLDPESVSRRVAPPAESLVEVG